MLLNYQNVLSNGEKTGQGLLSGFVWAHVAVVVMVLLCATGGSWAIMNDTGNSGTMTPSMWYTRPSGDRVEFPQGTMPGSILTPMARLDIKAQALIGEDETCGLGADLTTELLSMRLRVSAPRIKDIAAIAIAVENVSGINAPFAVGMAEKEVAAPGEADPDGMDTMAERIGDSDEPPEARIGIYTPDQDPIIAYLSITDLLENPAGEVLNPFDSSFTVNINFFDPNETIPPYEVNRRGSNSDFYQQTSVLNAPVNFSLPTTVSTPRDESRYKAFYILVATSDSLEDGGVITVGLDVPEGSPPSLYSDGEGGPPTSSILYNWSNGGLIVRNRNAVWTNQDDVCSIWSYTPPELFDALVFNQEISGTIACVDKIVDMVPIRKTHNVDEGDAPGDMGGLEFSWARSGDWRVWSQFPPAWPRLTDRRHPSWSQWRIRPISGLPTVLPMFGNSVDFFNRLAQYQGRNDEMGVSDYSGMYVCGRFHPDSGIGTDSLKSPEVYASGNQVYSVFGVDMAGGWQGGYDWRLKSLAIEVQGMGGLREIPRDGIDNDLDGLTDEWGVEDNPQDNLLPGRNDDFDFFAKLRLVEMLDLNWRKRLLTGVGIDGQALSADDLKLMDEIAELANNPRQMPEPYANPCNQSYELSEGSFNVGWDPVFHVGHVLDDFSAEDALEETDFTYPSKYYRDVVVPGFRTPDGPDNPCSYYPFGLSVRMQPELAIRFDLMEDPESQHYAPQRAAYLRQLIRIGALQSRWFDEDGDGLTDEETRNGIDDDRDGLTDEDLNFVPVFMAIDEEINNFFVDADGGRAGAYDLGTDAVFIDYNHNGVYDNGRVDRLSSNRDEFRGPGANPLVHGEPYLPPLAYPIDDDLDAQGEDGNPLTPPPVYVDGIDGDDAFTVLGANEDVRDLVFDYFNLGTNDQTGCVEFLSGWNSWVWEDTNNNSRLDPGIFSYRNPRSPEDNSVDTTLGDWGTPLDVRSPNSIDWRGDDRYLITYVFDADGPNIPIHADGKYDFFVGLQLPENTPIGSDFQASVLGANVKMNFDSRDDFNPPILQYAVVSDNYLRERYPMLKELAGDGFFTPPISFTSPARSTAYQVTKRQICHVEMADMMGYASPIEVDAGYLGRPYLEPAGNPTAIVGINLADSVTVDLSSVVYGNSGEESVGFEYPVTGGEAVNPSQPTEQTLMIDSIRINFDPVQLHGTGLFRPSGAAGDLMPLRDDVESGVALYRDVKLPDLNNNTLQDYFLNYEPGVFDKYDQVIELSQDTLSWNADPNDPVVQAGGYYVELKPKQPVAVPNTDFFEIPNNPDLSVSDPNRGYDFFVVIKTSRHAGNRHAFKAFIRPGDIRFVNADNIVGSGVMTTTYEINPPVVSQQVDGLATDLIPNSNSTPVFSFNIYDENETFYGEEARLAYVATSFVNLSDATSTRGFTPSDLQPITSGLLFNIPLDPAEDNDNDPRTHAIPDGIDNDGDGLTDEGVDNTTTFDPMRYTSLSGVAFFRDMPGSDTNGGFDDPLDPDVVVPDLPVFLSGEENFEFPAGGDAYLTLALDHDPVDPTAPGKGDPVEPGPFEQMPKDDINMNYGPDYFTVIRTSNSITDADVFRCEIGVRFAQFMSGTCEYTLSNVVGVPLAFMPGRSTGAAPVFPYRTPYSSQPLINSQLVPSQIWLAAEPLSPGEVYVPGMVASGAESDLFSIQPHFDLYETYNSLSSSQYQCIENGNSLPTAEFLIPRFSTQIDSELSTVPATVPLRWVDEDQDSPDAFISLHYFEVQIDPVHGEIFPERPGDSRFILNDVYGVPFFVNSLDELDNAPRVYYQSQRLGANNDREHDIFTWDACQVPDGVYRIAAVLNDGSNYPVMAFSGKILITNQEPTLTIVEP